ncbi:UNVERIFIED_CONTAM: Retrovirus-related Pol polyprotein from transposon [Sesamum radiatum]|uniref:Retrovirus-related Pol polyprotein from transposon n=1 Tax=Sesamum radiatum TaxID=300843 RepID=A0AAW2PLP2_SESRA
MNYTRLRSSLNLTFEQVTIRFGWHPTTLTKLLFGQVDGHFEFLVMPFGLSNAPSTFQLILPPLRPGLCGHRWGSHRLAEGKSVRLDTGGHYCLEALKTAMTYLPVLVLSDFSQPFDVTTDASQIAIGAVLSQNHHPIAFFSKKLGPRLQSASTYDRELYTISKAVRKWRQYLLRRKFNIFTDQQSLKAAAHQDCPARSTGAFQVHRSIRPRSFQG